MSAALLATAIVALDDGQAEASAPPDVSAIRDVLLADPMPSGREAVALATAGDDVVVGGYALTSGRPSGLLVHDAGFDGTNWGWAAGSGDPDPDPAWDPSDPSPDMVQFNTTGVVELLNSTEPLQGVSVEYVRVRKHSTGDCPWSGGSPCVSWDTHFDNSAQLDTYSKMQRFGSSTATLGNKRYYVTSVPVSEYRNPHSPHHPQTYSDWRLCITRLSGSQPWTCFGFDAGIVPIQRQLTTTVTCVDSAGIARTEHAVSAGYLIGDPLPDMPGVVCAAGESATDLVVTREAVDGSLPVRVLLDWDGHRVVGTAPVVLDPSQVEGAAGPVGTIADPVNTATGSLVESTVDLSVASFGIAAALDRFYDSDRTDPGLLGVGWRTSWEQTLSGDLTATDGAQVVHRSGDGHVENYTRQSDGSYLGQPGAQGVLVETANGFELRAVGPGPTITFDDAGLLVSMSDRNGNTTTVSRDANGHPDVVTAPSGRWLDLEVVGGLLEAATTDDGRSIDYGYTGGRLTSVTDPTGRTWGYRYDTAGRLDRATDPAGHALHTTTYDADGDVVSQVDAAGETWTFSYEMDAGGTGLVQTTAPDGGVTTDVYDGRVLVARVDALGRTTSTIFGDDLLPEATIGPDGARTVLTHDAVGRLVESATPMGAATTSYDTVGNVSAVTGLDGLATTFTHDAAGNVLSATAPGGRATTFTYDSRGLLTSSTDPAGRTTTYDYDTATGDLLSVTDNSGAVTSWTYDAAGRVATVTDAAANAAGATDREVSLTYDAAGRPLTSTDQLDRTATTSYDQAGRPEVLTDPVGRTVTTSYDAAGRVTAVQGPDPDIPPVTTTYDAMSRVASRTDAAGRTATYHYDLVGRIAQVDDPIGTASVTYDNAGRVATRTDHAGRVTAFVYDDAGRPVLTDRPGTTHDVAVTYDGAGRPTTTSDGTSTTTWTYHATTGEVTSIDRNGDTFTLDIDPATGELVAKTLPDGRVEAYTYDSTGRLDTIAVDGTQVLDNDYNQLGQLTRAVRGNGVVHTRAYDAAGRLTDMQDSLGPQVLSSLAYTFDDRDLPVQIVRDGTPTAYRYGPSSRLEGECRNATSCPETATGAGVTSWTYNTTGQPLTRTTGILSVLGIPVETTDTWDYDQATGQPASFTPAAGTTRTFALDASGNVIDDGARTYTWDVVNRMTSASDGSATWIYGYDEHGQRTTVDDGTTTTTTVWDPTTDLPVLDRTATATTATYLPANLGVAADSGQQWFVTDHLGSIRATTDATGGPLWDYDYTAYGRQSAQWAGSGDQVDHTGHGYTGQRHDATGLLHLRARQYDPDTSLFLSSDPAGHGYAYAHANPIIYTDPYGTYASSPVRAALQSVNQASGWMALGAGVAALALTATGVGAPAAIALLTVAAATAGAVEVGTAVALGADSCTTGKCISGTIGIAMAAAPGPNIGRHLPAGMLDDIARKAPRTTGVLVEGVGSGTRTINFRPTTDPNWGLTRAHLDKHLFGSGPTSLRQIDAAGNPDLWRNYIQDLAGRPATSTLKGGIQDVIGTFPRADGSGAFQFGIRIAPGPNGSWDLVTLLTRQ